MNKNGKRCELLRNAFVTVLLCAIAFSNIFNVSAQAKQQSCTRLYNAVKKTYGSSFPLSGNNMINTERKNIFGQYSTVLGVSAKYFSDFKAAKKSNSKEEYICFVCKASSGSNVKNIKAGLKKFVANEAKSNTNYFAAKGKKLISQAKIGSKGKYVYLFVLDTGSNKKAIEAFKKAVS